MQNMIFVSETLNILFFFHREKDIKKNAFLLVLPFEDISISPDLSSPIHFRIQRGWSESDERRRKTEILVSNIGYMGCTGFYSQMRLVWKFQGLGFFSFLNVQFVLKIQFLAKRLGTNVSYQWNWWLQKPSKLTLLGKGKEEKNWIFDHGQTYFINQKSC